jgi:hypothetical protein
MKGLFIPQRKLEQVIADLPELLVRPAEVLAKNEVRIGRMRMHKAALSAVLGGPILLLWHSHHLVQQVDEAVVMTLFGLAIGVAAAICILLFSPHYAIRLTAEGVMFQNGRREVRCPWALFNTPGNYLLKDRRQLLLPVSSGAVPYVELRQEECFRAQGAAVKTKFFRFLAADTLWLRCAYEAFPDEVGELLLRLGRTLGTHPPSGWVPAEAHPTEEVHAVPVGVAGADGSITLSLTRLFLPPVCSACGQVTNLWTVFQAPKGWNELFVLPTLNLLNHFQPIGVEIPIPLCASCQEQFHRAWHRGSTLGMIAGLLLTTPLGVLILTSKILDDVFKVALVIVLIFFSFGLGCYVGGALAKWRRTPVHSVRYSARRGTIYLRFRRAEYAELVAETVQAMEKKT